MVAQKSTQRERAKRTELGSVGAPMPGKVIAIKVKEGDVVKKGAALVVLSAMKMETVVAAPMAGHIVRLAVKTNDELSGGDLLLEIGA